MTSQEINDLNAELTATKKAILTMENYYSCWEMGDESRFERLCEDRARIEKLLNDQTIA